jgi:hypothetical protein
LCIVFGAEMTASFDFLKSVSGDMAYYANIAAEQADSYPTSSLNSSRSFADLAAQLIAENHNYPVYEDASRKRKRDTYDIYQDIQHLLDSAGEEFYSRIFRWANPSSHGQTGVTADIDKLQRRANEVVDHATAFALWLTHNYSSSGGFFNKLESIVRPIYILGACAAAVFFLFVVITSKSPNTSYVSASPTSSPVTSPPVSTRPSTPPTFPKVSAIVIGREVKNDQLIGISNSFQLPVPSIAARMTYSDVIPNRTVLKLVLGSYGDEFPCDPTTTPYANGTLDCEWSTNLSPGTHRIYAYVDSTLTAKTFDILPGVPDPAPPTLSKKIIPPPPTISKKDIAPPTKSKNVVGNDLGLRRAPPNVAQNSDEEFRRQLNTPGCELLARDGFDTTGCVQGHINADGNLEGPGSFTGPGYMR